MKHGIANKSVAFKVYVALITTEPVTVNFFDQDLFYESHILFLGHHLAFP